MTDPSTSTSPVEKLRWKFSMSVAAFHKHHSAKENSLSFLTLAEVFRKVSFCTSPQVFSGTKKSRLASMPSLDQVMRV